MKLEINPEDKKANLSLLKEMEKQGKRVIIGGLASIMLFSGWTPPEQAQAKTVHQEEINDMLDTQDPTTIVDIPESYLYEVLDACNKEEGDLITIGDLQQIGNNGEDIYFNIDDNSSLEWLNYCTNIKKLTLIISTDDISVLEEVKKLDNLEKLNVYSVHNVTLTQKNSQWLKESPKLKELHLLGCYVEPGVLENLTNLQKLSLLDESSKEVNYEKLTFLKELEFLSDQPYEIAIGFTKKDYDTLVNHGVKISFEEETKNKVLEINERLEKIVQSLNLSENSTDQEKLDAILIYILDNLTYDEQVSEAITQNIDHESLTESFYEGGTLYGALEKDSSICGNYAAMLEALAERTGLQTNFLYSDNHAWNLVKIEGDYYYVDATWLDGNKVEVEKNETVYDEDGNLIQMNISWDQIAAQEAIKEGKTDELEWYMEDPINYQEETKEAKESHEANNIPDYITLRPIKKQKQANPETKSEETIVQETKEEDISSVETEKQEEKAKKEETQTEQKEEVENQKFEIQIGNKKWIIGGAVVVGIMTALGSAIGIHHSKEKKRRERIKKMHQSMNSNYSYNDYGNFKKY